MSVTIGKSAGNPFDDIFGPEPSIEDSGTTIVWGKEDTTNAKRD